MSVSGSYPGQEESKGEFEDILSESGKKTEKYDVEGENDPEISPDDVDISKLEAFQALESQVAGQQEDINQIESQIVQLENEILDIDNSLQQVVESSNSNTSEIEDIQNRLTDPEKIKSDTSIMSVVEEQITNIPNEAGAREIAHQVTEDRIIRPLLLLTSIIIGLGSIVGLVSGPVLIGIILLSLTIFTWYLLYMSGK